MVLEACGLASDATVPQHPAVLLQLIIFAASSPHRAQGVRPRNPFRLTPRYLTNLALLSAPATTAAAASVDLTQLTGKRRHQKNAKDEKIIKWLLFEERLNDCFLAIRFCNANQR